MLGALAVPATAALAGPVLLTPPPLPAPPPAEQPPTPADAQVAEVRLLELMNRERVAAGLNPLTPRDDVQAVAREHSARMAAAGDIWHNDEFFSRESHGRLGARSVGENVALNRSVDDAHARLMNSPGHRANIMSQRFSVVGVGVATDASGRFYITEAFVEPADSSSPPPSEEEPRRSAPNPAPVALVAAVHPAPPSSSAGPPEGQPAGANQDPLITPEDGTDAAVLSRGSDAMAAPDTSLGEPARLGWVVWIAAGMLLGVAVASARRLTGVGR